MEDKANQSKQMEQRTLDWYRARLGKFTASSISKLMESGREEDDESSRKGVAWFSRNGKGRFQRTGVGKYSKYGFSKNGKAYILQVMGERLLDEKLGRDDELFAAYVRQNQFVNKYMQWGIDHEKEAKAAYMDKRWSAENVKARLNDLVPHDLIEVGSIDHERIPRFAASPDGLVRNADNDGGMRVVEVKCPMVGAATEYLSEIHDAESLKAIKPEYYWQMVAEMSCTDADGGDFVVYCPFLSIPLHVVFIERNEWDIEALEERVIAANGWIDGALLALKDRVENGKAGIYDEL